MADDTTPAPASTGLLRAMGRHPWVVVVGVVVGVALGALAPALLGARYEATTRVILRDPSTADLLESRTHGDPERRIGNHLEILRSREVRARAAEIADLPLSPVEVREQVNVGVSETSDAVTISASAESPTAAAALANGVATAFQEALQDREAEQVADATRALQVVGRQLREQLVSIQEELASASPATEPVLEQRRDQTVAELHGLDVTIQQLGVDAQLAGSFALRERAESPAGSATIGPTLGALVGGLAGLTGAAFLAWWLTERRRVTPPSHDPARGLELPVVGAVTLAGQGRRLVALPPGPQDGPMLALPGVGPLLITATTEFLGRPAAAVDVAGRLDAGRSSTVLVDCTVGGWLGRYASGAADAAGLNDVAHKGASLAHALIPIVDEDTTIMVLPRGTHPGPGHAAIDMTDVADVAARLQTEGFRVVLYAPALASLRSPVPAGVVEGAVIMTLADAALPELELARRRLPALGTPVFGCVVVHGTTGSDQPVDHAGQRTAPPTVGATPSRA